MEIIMYLGILCATAAFGLMAAPALAGGSAQHSAASVDHSAQSVGHSAAAIVGSLGAVLSVPLIVTGGALVISGAALADVTQTVTRPVGRHVVAPDAAPKLD
jgi:hypothetical protein